MRLPVRYARLFRDAGLSTMGKTMWNDLFRTPFTTGMWTGTAATAGALMMGLPMALGGAYDFITGRRRDRLSAFTSLAAGAAVAGMPFYGTGLYRWLKPHVTDFWNRL